MQAFEDPEPPGPARSVSGGWRWGPGRVPHQPGEAGPLGHMENTTSESRRPAESGTCSGSSARPAAPCIPPGAPRRCWSELIWIAAVRRDTGLAVPEPVPAADGSPLTIVEIERRPRAEGLRALPLATGEVPRRRPHAVAPGARRRVHRRGCTRTRPASCHRPASRAGESRTSSDEAAAYVQRSGRRAVRPGSGLARGDVMSWCGGPSESSAAAPTCSVSSTRIFTRRTTCSIGGRCGRSISTTADGGTSSTTSPSR